MSTVLSTRLKLWFAAAAVALVASFALRYVAISNVVVTERQAAGIRDALGAMDAVIETLEDAQSGQLNYLITGNERFLKAYQQAPRRDRQTTEPSGRIDRRRFGRAARTADGAAAGGR